MSRRRKRTPNPSPVLLGPYRARVARGPRADGRHYWRVSDKRMPAGCIWATRTEVEEDLARRLTGTNTIAEPIIPPPTTLGELVTRWYAIQDGRADIVVKTKSVLKHHSTRLVQAAGTWPLTEVRRKAHELRGILTGKKTTIQGDLKTLRRIWRWGNDQGWTTGHIPRIPVAGPPPERRTPSTAEADVMASLEGEYRIAYQVIRATGCRGVGVERLTWGHIDADNGALTIVGKGMRERTVPVPNSLINALNSLPHHHGDKVFDRRILTNLRNNITSACKRLGITSFGLHGLRRLRVREYRRAGVSITVAASLFGHTPKVMLEHYDAASEEEQRDELARVWARDGSDVQVTNAENGPQNASTCVDVLARDPLTP